MIAARDIIESLATTEYAPAGRFPLAGARQSATGRRERDVARFALRFLEECPDEASVLELRHALQDAFPHVLSGGGGT